MKIRTGVILAFLAVVSNSIGQSRQEVDLNKSRVEIPWTEFSDLLSKIQKPVIKPLSDTILPPVDYLLSSSVISAKVVDGKVVRLTFEAIVEVLRSGDYINNGWVSIPVGRWESEQSRAVLEHAELNGAMVPIHINEEIYEILVSRSGKHKLKLDYYVPLNNEEGSWNFTVSLPRCAAAKLSFTIPGISAQLWVNGMERDVSVRNRSTFFESVISLEDELIVHYS